MKKKQDSFVEELTSLLSGKNFEVCGILSTDGKIYSLGDDSKLIRRIFEILSYRFIKELCDRRGWELIPTKIQNVYPDYTIKISRDKDELYALDVKTSYRHEGGVVSFTLGAYGSFLRDGSKGIAFPLKRYSKHYVLGFVYDRNSESMSGQIIKDQTSPKPPYTHVDFFVQEKYRIAGDSPGSGNTENIGSIRSKNIDDFRMGSGPFSKLGNRVFEDYWKNYPRYRRADEKLFTSIINFRFYPLYAQL